MKLVQIKTARELKLPGTHVEFVTEGDNLIEVILRPEGEEETYSIKKTDAYTANVKVFIRRDFEVVERYRLSGSVHGVNVQQDYVHEHDANKARDKFPESDGLEVKLVKVRLNDVGAPVGPAPGDDIPF